MKPMVENAANTLQVKKAKKRESFERERELDDIRWILSDKRGRRFVWRILGKCHLFQSIWRMSAEIHFLAGKQDLGNYLLAEITEARDMALIEMMKESKENDNG